MASLVKEVELYNSVYDVSNEVRVDSGSAITITTYGTGTCNFEVSTDSGKTFFSRFMVNMSNANVGSTLIDEGMFYTICGDCDVVRVTNIVGFDKIVATIS